ncbi:MAG: tetratricopeptide repeat protein, partial [Anaerolineae bacterium]
MTISSFSTPGVDEALIALAILARADAVMLADVAGLNLAAQDLAGLAAHSAVQTSGSTFTLDPETASEVLTALERDDLPGYRTRHERALTVLLAGVQAGMETAEPILMTVFERLANRLLMDDPQRLIELVEQMEDVPWQTAVGAQRRRYFKGVALRKAERYHDSLAVFDALLTEPELDVTIRGRTLNSRAICYRLIGRLEEALTDYRASLALWRQLDDSQYEGAVLLNMGIIAYELQNYDDAEDNLRQAAGIFTKIGSLWRLAVVQNELGIVYRDQGRWAESLACFETYVAQRQADGADDSVGRGLNNLGEVLLFQGRFAEAIAALQKAIEKMSTHVYQIDTHLHLGLAYQATGKLEQAYAAFQRALKLAEAINRREILPHVHYRLGDVLLRQGAGSDALAQFEAAAEVIESTREPIRDEGLKISLLGRWQQVYEALVLMHVDNGRFQEAFL